MKMLRAQLENVKSNPDYLMEDKFIDVAYGNNPRRQMVSTEIIDKFSFRRCRPSTRNSIRMPTASYSSSWAT